ncbi:MAG: Hsp33 family molecular chaperone HslO [Verrucomicrobiota bacterium]
MAEDPDQVGEAGASDSEFVQVTSHFVRERNALAVQADFSPLFVDYYLHQMDQGMKYPPREDTLLKDGLAAVVLHATTRPWKETHAWTLTLPDPVRSVFVTAGSLIESATGRVFTEGVREEVEHRFYAQVSMKGQETRQSVVEFSGQEVFSAVEQFYEQSEQRLARLFRLEEEEVVLVSAQPDCDEEWLAQLDNEQLSRLHVEETTTHLETRRFQFRCGCNVERIFPALAPLAAQGLDDLFQGDEAITIQCPRCAARWRLTRETVEAMMADSPPSP